MKLALEGHLAHMEADLSRCQEADKPRELKGLPVRAGSPQGPRDIIDFFFYNPCLQRYELTCQLILASMLIMSQVNPFLDSIVLCQDILSQQQK